MFYYCSHLRKKQKKQIYGLQGHITRDRKLPTSEFGLESFRKFPKLSIGKFPFLEKVSMLYNAIVIYSTSIYYVLHCQLPSHESRVTSKAVYWYTWWWAVTQYTSEKSGNFLCPEEVSKPPNLGLESFGKFPLSFQNGKFPFWKLPIPMYRS